MWHVIKIPWPYLKFPDFSLTFFQVYKIPWQFQVFQVWGNPDRLIAVSGPKNKQSVKRQLHLWGNNRVMRQAEDYWLMISENTVKFWRRNLPDINTSITGSSCNVLVIRTTAVHNVNDNYNYNSLWCTRHNCNVIVIWTTLVHTSNNSYAENSM